MTLDPDALAAIAADHQWEEEHDCGAISVLMNVDHGPGRGRGPLLRVVSMQQRCTLDAGHDGDHKDQLHCYDFDRHVFDEAHVSHYDPRDLSMCSCGLRECGVRALVAEVQRLTPFALMAEGLNGQEFYPGTTAHDLLMRAEAAEALVAEKDAEIRDLVEEGIRQKRRANDAGAALAGAESLVEFWKQAAHEKDAALAAESQAHADLRERVADLRALAESTAKVVIERDLWNALGWKGQSNVIDRTEAHLRALLDADTATAKESGHAHRWEVEYLPDPMSAGSVVRSSDLRCSCGATRPDTAEEA